MSKMIFFCLYFFISSLTYSQYQRNNYLNSTFKSIKILESWEILNSKRVTVVAVIDTGAGYTSFLKENFYLPDNIPVSSDQYGIDFTFNDKFIFPKLQKQYSFLPFEGDDLSHGSHGAGIIKSIMPDVKLLILKYDHSRASDEKKVENMLQAFRYAIDQGVDIINFSSTDSRENSSLKTLIKEANDKGILVVVPSGNGSLSKVGFNLERNCNIYPACYDLPNIITVGAYGDHFAFVKSSNYGESVVDIMAPGVEVESESYLGIRLSLSGTSQAAFIVSGVVALFLSQFDKEEVDHLWVKKMLIESRGIGESKTPMERRTKGKSVNAYRFILSSEVCKSRDPSSMASSKKLIKTKKGCSVLSKPIKQLKSTSPQKIK